MRQSEVAGTPPAHDFEVMIQACLCDIGNVLVSFDYRRTFGQLEGRTSRTFEEIRDHLSSLTDDLETGQLSSEDFVDRAVAFLGKGIDGEGFRSAFTGIFEPIEPVWEALSGIRPEVPVYLFSNTSDLHEHGLFEQYPAFAKFRGGFYSWRVGSMKPDAAFYEHALAKLGLPAASIAYIDDLPANIETGRRLGLQSHRYDRTRHNDFLDFLDQWDLRKR